MKNRIKKRISVILALALGMSCVTPIAVNAQTPASKYSMTMTEDFGIKASEHPELDIGSETWGVLGAANIRKAYPNWEINTNTTLETAAGGKCIRTAWNGFDGFSAFYNTQQFGGDYTYNVVEGFWGNDFVYFSSTVTKYVYFNVSGTAESNALVGYRLKIDKVKPTNDAIPEGTTITVTLQKNNGGGWVDATEDKITARYTACPYTIKLQITQDYDEATGAVAINVIAMTGTATQVSDATIDFEDDSPVSVYGYIGFASAGGRYEGFGDVNVGYTPYRVSVNGEENAVISDYSGQTVDLSLSLDNLTNSDDAYTAVFTIFDNNKLVWSKPIDGAFTNGEWTETVSETVSIPQLSASAYVKVFIWDSMSGMSKKYPPHAEVTPQTASDFTISEVGGAVTVSGYAPTAEAGAEVNMILIKPDKTVESLSENDLSYIAETTTAADGSYTFTFNMSDDSDGGQYTCYVGGASFEAPKHNSFPYVTAEWKNESVKKINKSADLATKLEEENIKITLGYGTALYNAIGVQTIAEKLQEDRDTNGAFNETDGGADFITRLNTVMTLIAYNNSMSEYLFDTDGNFTLWSYAGIDEKYDCTAESIYDSKLTADGKTFVKDYLQGKDLTSVTELEKLFVEAVIVSGIKNFNTDGTEHINSLIKGNAEAINWDISDYSTILRSGEIDAQLYALTFTNLAEFKPQFDEIVGQYMEDNKYVDLTTYQYNFTESDLESSEWAIGSGFTKFSKGLYAPEGSASNARVISPFELSGDYEIYLDVYVNYNAKYIIFNRQDANNYYKIGVNSERAVLTKIVDGVATELANVSSPIGSAYQRVTLGVTYNSDGYINGSIQLGSNKKTFYKEDIHDTTFKSGKFGASIEWTPGYVAGFEVRNYLSVTGGNVVSGKRIGVDDNLTVIFNQPVNKYTVDGNFEILKNGELFEDYTYSVTDNNMSIIINPNSELDVDSEYTFVLKPGLFMLNRNTGAMCEKHYTVKTELPGISVTNFTTAGGTISLNLENKTSNSNAYLVAVSVKNGDSTQAYAKASTGVINGETAVSVPLGTYAVATGQEAEYYALDDITSMKTLYPYVEGQITDETKQPEFTVNQYGTDIILKGTTDSKQKGRGINVIILDKGKTTADITTANAIAYQTRLTSGVDGAYELTLPMQDEDATYTVFVGGDDYGKATSKTVNFISDTTAETAALAIKDDPSTIVTQIDNLAVNQELKAYIESEESWLELEDRIRTKSFATDDGGEEIEQYVNEQMLLMALEDGQENLLFEADGRQKLAEIVDLSKDGIIAENAWDIYANNLTPEGRTKVANGLLGGSYTTVEPTLSRAVSQGTDLYTRFVQSVVLYSMKNYNMSGYGHINKILKDNASYAKMSIPNYLANTSGTGEIDNSILNGTYTTIGELETLINTLTTPTTPTNPGTIDKPSQDTSSNRGSSGGGAGVVTKPETIDNIFKDIAAVDWAKDAISYCYKNNIISGDGDGNYRPNDAVKREEFIKMAVEAFKLNGGKTEDMFTDCDSEMWYAKYVSTAKTLGVVNGRDDGSFGIGEHITREDVVVILYRILELNGAIEAVTASDAQYTDLDDVSDYATDAMTYMINAGVISGMDDGRVAPKDNCTRAQVAKIIYSMVGTAN